MITSLRLENWRSHQESGFSFGPGTNVLVGIVGSGKSSVLDGLCFALFGTFPALQQRRIKLDEVIRKRPAASQGKVSAGFRVGEKEYQVLREIKRGKGTTTAELRLDGKLVDGPNAQAVTKKVEELLGVDYDLFSRAIYAEQNQMDYFLRIPKGQRMSKIDDLLRIDRFENARKNCLTVINDFRSSIDERERVLGDFESVNREEETRIKGGIDEIKKRVEGDRKRYEEVDRKKSTLEKVVREAELTYREFTNVSVRLEQLQEREKELEKQICAKETPKEVEKELESSQKELDAAQNELNKLATAIGVNQQTLEKYRQDVQNLAELQAKLESLDVEKLRSDLKRLSSDYENQKSREQGLKTRKGLLERSIKLIDTSEECPVCKTRLEKSKRDEIKKDEARELGEIETELSGMDLEARGNEKRDVEITLRRTEQLAEMIKNMGEPANEVERLGKLVEVLKEKREVQEKKHSEAQERKSVFETWAEIEKLKRDIGACEAEKSRLGFDEKEYRKRKERFEALLEEWSRAKARYGSSAEILKERERQKRELEERLKRVEKLSEELEMMKQGKEFLIRFQNALKVTQGELRRQFVRSLNDCMSELWNCYPYGDYTSIRLAIEEGDYVLQVRERRGDWIGVEGTVSGGERSTAALVLRMAFALVLAPQLSMLVLDEPTHNLDTRSVEELAITLRERIKDYINQVFVITHDEMLEGAVSGTLYRLERNKAEDGPTEIVLGEMESE